LVFRDKIEIQREHHEPKQIIKKYLQDFLKLILPNNYKVLKRIYEVVLLDYDNFYQIGITIVMLRYCKSYLFFCLINHEITL
jgi:hypothetical protein